MTGHISAALATVVLSTNENMQAAAHIVVERISMRAGGDGSGLHGRTELCYSPANLDEGGLS